VKPQTILVSGDFLGGQYLGTGNKAYAYCYGQECDLSDLCHRYTCPSFHQQLLCVYPSPPVQGMHACVRVGGRGLELLKQSGNENQTEIGLLINQHSRFYAANFAKFCEAICEIP